jgi:methoxymalonate biosynthesis protein
VTETVKCLVWDLDRTLWTGILLEGDEVAVPEPVRDVVLTLDARGILQSVASRNDHEQAWRRLEEFGLAEYFVVPQIGWGRKSDAVRAVADQLSFAPSALAFIDDQPAERAEVAYHLPQVRCYPAEQASALVGLPEFSPAVTADAGRRRAMYQAGFRRDLERSAFTGPDEAFLRSLELALRVHRATEDDLLRVEELTLRTSQMNATGVHYPAAVLRSLLADPGHDVLVCTLDDRFGPHGAIGIVLLARHPACWHLRLLATSCRVVAFGVGAVILRWLTDQAAAAGVHLAADFRRTERNRMMEVAYRFAGFTDQACPCLATLGGGGGPDRQRLHLVPARQAVPDRIRVTAPALAVPAPGELA